MSELQGEITDEMATDLEYLAEVARAAYFHVQSLIGVAAQQPGYGKAVAALDALRAALEVRSVTTEEAVALDVTDEMVERAWNAGQDDLPVGRRWDKSALRVALRAALESRP